MRYPLPEHLGGFKFERGQAVLILKSPMAGKGYLTTIPGVITNAGDYFLTVQTEQGRKRVVPTELHHRGYCPLCQVAAHLDGDRLICPRCEGDASAPAPDDLLPEWDWRGMFCVSLDRTMLHNGCTRNEAHQILKGQQRAAWNAMMEQTGLMESYKRFDPWWFTSGAYGIEKRMQRAADRGDVAGFLEGYEDLKRAALHHRVYELLEIRDALAADDDGPPPAPPQVARPASDSQPDGADDTTRWLEQQFRRAA